MKKEVYLCSEYLEAHPLFKSFGSDLATLAERDYPGEGVFRNYEIPAIDLDSYEISLRSSNDCTSDGVIGIANVSQSCFSDRRLLLSELRIGYKNARNLDYQNIRRKYAHSVDVLREFDPDVRIDSEFALIFRKSTVLTSQRIFWSWAKESSKKDAANWKSYDPESFCNHINYGRKLPLHPNSETVAKVAEWCVNGEMTFNELNTLKEKILAYWWIIKGRNRLVDLEYVSKKMISFFREVSFPSEEDGELCILLKEEIEEIISLG